MMKRLIATAALATLVATPAFAQSYPGVPDEGPYLGAGIGHAKLDFDIEGFYRDLGFPNVSSDDTDVSYKLFAGYQFNPYFAVEAGYVDFGSFTASSTATDFSGNAKLSVDGFTAALVGKLPIQSGFSVYGKLGMVAWDADLKESASFMGMSASASYGEDGTDPFYGIGAEYVVDQIMMRAELERYDISESGEDFTIDMISASIGYRF
ncbi:outer membrane beta-barrel protein [Halomonas sp. C05BenzN]|uniref:outer membrane beta-barrel protein n=1 Tax=Halomonas sp. C05BenzN TaxID=3411041 RepID=UPI003B943B4F